MKFVVTGGAGMIGSNLVKRLVRDGHEVFVVDNLWRGKLENLRDERGKYVVDLDKYFINADLSASGVLDSILPGIEFVYHLADVVAGVDYVFKNQGTVFHQNCLINTHVIQSVRKSKIKGYIYVGTACSFPAHLQSGVNARPLREEDQMPASPESGYGWSKLMGEYEAFLMEKEVGIPVSVPVLHNVFGAPCEFGVRAQVIPALIERACRFPKEEFKVWGSGSQGRSFIHVDDVVEGLLLAREKGLGKGIIQLGTTVCTSIREIAEMIVEISGKPIAIQFDLSKPEGDKGRSCDSEKARTILGWKPRKTLKSGLAELYAWSHDRLQTGD